MFDSRRAPMSLHVARQTPQPASQAVVLPSAWLSSIPTIWPRAWLPSPAAMAPHLRSCHILATFNSRSSPLNMVENPNIFATTNQQKSIPFQQIQRWPMPLHISDEVHFGWPPSPVRSPFCLFWTQEKGLSCGELRHGHFSTRTSTCSHPGSPFSQLPASLPGPSRASKKVVPASYYCSICWNIPIYRYRYRYRYSI